MIENYPSVLIRPVSIGHEFRGLNIVPPASFDTIPRGDDFYDLIDSMLIDSQVTAALGLRKRRALTANSHEPDGDAQAVEIVQNVLDRLTWVHDIEDSLSAIEWGFCVQEIMWEVVDGSWMIESIELRDPRHFQFRYNEMTGSIDLLYNANGEWNVAPERKFILHTYRATRENPYGKSILENCFPEWAAKWLTAKYLARLGEKFMVPSIIALTDSNDGKDLEKIGSQLAALENSMGAALSGVKELIQLKATSEAEALRGVIEFYNQGISKALTSQTLALDAGDRGSYALGDVHAENLDALCAMDMDASHYKFNRTLLVWICELNGVSGRCRLPVNAMEKVMESRIRKNQPANDYMF